MNVSLELENASHDITEFLDDEQDIELRQEHELKAFQRTVDDIRFRCSNLDGQFTTWLGSPSSVKPRIVIRDQGRVLFRGQIEQPVRFDVRGEWVEFDCFSMTKAFWGRCRQLKVMKGSPAKWPTGSPGGPPSFPPVGVPGYVGTERDLYMPIQYVLTRECAPWRFSPDVPSSPDIPPSFPPGNGLFVGYQIDPIYAGSYEPYIRPRLIRFWGYVADQSIGNNGRYKDLDPQTTVDELLKAMMLYYNADIFIDPETQLLVMQKRDEVQNDVNHPLDDVLEEDDEIKVEVYDEKVDYIGLMLNLGKPVKPQVLLDIGPAGYTPNYLSGGRYKWAVTFVYRSGDLEIEANLGEESDPQGLKAGAHHIRLNIPLGPSGCVSRRIYRTRNGGIGSYFLVGVLDNNSDTEFLDTVPNEELSIVAPRTGAMGEIWLRYDETTGKWDDVIVGDSNGLNRPAGDIHDVTPKLRFLRPFGKALEIAAIYPYDGKTRIRTKEEHGFERDEPIQIHYTNCTPQLEGNYNVLYTYDDKLTFSLHGGPVTAPGVGGTVMRLADINTREEVLEMAEESLFDVFAFFGNEKDRLAELQSQWINLFRSRKRVKCTVEGLAYRVGDSASLNRQYNSLTIGACMIKRAKNNLTKERTQLELLTL